MHVFRVSVQLVTGMLMLVFAAGAHSFFSSTTFDFNVMADPGGSHGESAWNSLDLSGNGFNVSITGTKDGNSGFAYLDANNAGLGVCGSASGAINTLRPGNGGNLCNPASDDNTTVGEVLHFMFDADVIIENFWFNNNHDGGFGSGDLVDIGNTAFAVQTGYAGGANGIGSFNVAAGDTLTVGFNNQQFYVSAMEVRFDAPPPPQSVPEPGTLLLLALGLLYLGYRGKFQRPESVMRAERVAKILR